MTPEYHAHYSCAHCHGLKARADIIHWNGQAVCRDGDCLNHMKGKYRAEVLDYYRRYPANPWDS